MKSQNPKVVSYLLLKKVLLPLCFLLTSCESLDFSDCIIRKDAELPDKELKRGHAGQYYYDELKASVNNDPHDDGYYYNFSIAESLPEGLDVIVDGRYVIFEGITLKKGQYNIYISLGVDPYEYDDEEGDIDVCSTGNTSRRYKLIIGD